MSKKFHARTFDEADGRRSSVKALRKLLDELMKDGGADSVQKQLLCKRAAFIALRLESIETDAAEGKEVDYGSWGQLTNCLIGLLSRLGIEKSVLSQVTDLQAHLKQYEKKKKRK